jgi:hypothetical protein
MRRRRVCREKRLREESGDIGDEVETPAALKRFF